MDRGLEACAAVKGERNTERKVASTQRLKNKVSEWCVSCCNWGQNVLTRWAAHQKVQSGGVGGYGHCGAKSNESHGKISIHILTEVIHWIPKERSEKMLKKKQPDCFWSCYCQQVDQHFPPLFHRSLSLQAVVLTNDANSSSSTLSERKGKQAGEPPHEPSNTPRLVCMT